jgi:hypothetical protein
MCKRVRGEVSSTMCIEVILNASEIGGNIFQNENRNTSMDRNVVCGGIISFGTSKNTLLPLR